MQMNPQDRPSPVELPDGHIENWCSARGACGEIPHVSPAVFLEDSAGFRRLPIACTEDIAILGKMPLVASGEAWKTRGKSETAIRRVPKFFAHFDSWLSPRRKDEISSDVSTLIPQLQRHRLAHLQALRQTRLLSPAFSTKSVPGWVRLSPTSSESGNRLIIGLRHNTCAYRNNEPLGLGCFNCGYYAGSGEERGASLDELMCQIRLAFKRGFSYGKPFDVVELLGDGSFLNDEEVSEEAQQKILGFLAEIPYVKRVLVESTPEHVSQQEDQVAATLERLRMDQQLEIGIGLETADDLIRKACINKGYTLNAFEAAVKKISGVNARTGNRCSVLAYVLVKPALLTVSESVRDTIRTLRCLASIAEKHGVRIIPKLEPVAIAHGTLLSLLHSLPSGDRLHYAALNYWAILEILTQAFVDVHCKTIFPWIRIGGREDMDDVVKLPAVYAADGRYDQFDFILYDELQEFNRHHDLFRVYAAIHRLYPGGLRGLVETPNGFNSWLGSEFESGESQIVAFIRSSLERISALDPSDVSESDDIFRRLTYRVLDEIEGHDKDATALHQIRQFLCGKSCLFDENAKEGIGKVIADCYRRENRPLIEVEVLDVVRESGQFVRVFFEVLDFVSGKVSALWAGIPVS